MIETRIRIGGMSCGKCLASATRALEAIDGVQSATVSLERAEATVMHDAQRVSRQRLVEAIEAAGFDAD